jgi:hypothetical protein
MIAVGLLHPTACPARGVPSFSAPRIAPLLLAGLGEQADADRVGVEDPAWCAASACWWWSFAAACFQLSQCISTALHSASADLLAVGLQHAQDYGCS